MSTVRIHKSPTAEQRRDRDILPVSSLVEKRTSRGDARYHKKKSPTQVALRPLVVAVQELERRVDSYVTAEKKRRADKRTEELQALIDESIERTYKENEVFWKKIIS